MALSGKNALGYQWQVEQLLLEQEAQDLPDDEEGKSLAADLSLTLQAKEEKSFLVLRPQSGQTGFLAVAETSCSN
jgi:hypothetical protein